MPTVLVVEDERDIREVLRRWLERAGLSVLTAGTGADAIRLLTSAPPDLPRGGRHNCGSGAVCHGGV